MRWVSCRVCWRRSSNTPKTCYAEGMPKLLRIGLVLLPTVAFVVLAATYITRKSTENPPSGSGSSGRGKLVVVAVFDQFRGDYTERWSKQFGPNGFARIQRDGVSYTQAHLPTADTSTGPGHACIATGQPPNVHGIVENEWFDRKLGMRVYCAQPYKRYERVPSSVLVDPVTKRTFDAPGLSPERINCDSIGDHLRKEHPNSRVYSLALKDRTAVLLGGHHPSAMYCFDTAQGEFHTSSYYADTVPSWVMEFNKSGAADAWFTKQWERLGTQEKYDSIVGPDDYPGETRYEKDIKTGALVGYGPTFPHPMNIDQQPYPNKRYYERLESSPHGNDLLWQFATAAIEAEQLGTRGTTDLLYLGFSSNDLIGHRWGPDSHEVFDCTLRTDALVEKMIDHLDAKLGPGNYTLFITADHGICPFPEKEQARNPEAERFDPRAELDPAVMGEVLNNQFGKLADDPRTWFAENGKSYFPTLYLNRGFIEANGLKVNDMAEAIAKWAENRDHIVKAVPRGVLLGPPSADPLTRQCQISHDDDRSGDVFLIIKPYCVPLGPASVGTNHGSPNSYDTHVVMMAYGADVPKLCRSDEKINSLSLAPMICKALGMAPPKNLPADLPSGWK
jgi:Type I phosphodiesterase / nucleotide pyrophosphatase